jgi:hypothetical protein
MPYNAVVLPTKYVLINIVVFNLDFGLRKSCYEDLTLEMWIDVYVLFQPISWFEFLERNCEIQCCLNLL